MIAVFGGTGFLGRRVVQALVDQGEAVRVVARHASEYLPDGVSCVRADIRDGDSVAPAVEGCDAVVNAVSLYVERKDASFDDIHVRGAERIGRCAKTAGVQRLVHVSGVGVAPDSPSAFVRARWRGEEIVRDVFEKTNIVRPCVMFGRDDALLHSLAIATRLPAVPLFGRGQYRLQPVWVEDVALAICSLASANGNIYNLYEFGGARVYRYRELVALVQKHLRRKRPLMPVPFAVWRGLSRAMQPLPNPPLTYDQVVLMKSDNVVSGGAHTLADLDIQAHSLEGLLDQCLPVDPK